MNIILTIVFALLGAAIGSFLSVCIDRLPVKKSLVYPPSRCPACQHRLSLKDLIPLFSYLWLRGHCRYCQAPIPRRVFWVEVGTGLLFALTYWHYGLGIESAITAFYGCVFIVIGVIDLEHKLILNKLVYPMAVVALIISLFLPTLGIVNLPLPWPGILDGIIGGAIGFVLLLIPALIYRGGMGWGDVKAAALIGLVTRFPLVFVAIITGAVLGGLVAGILLLLKIKKRKEPIPFGPFLALATIATLLWGSNILNWYLGLF
jgi:leader peptidase (prepilin peptidase)/N-methyltransferase